jgi:hypothetical protein
MTFTESLRPALARVMFSVGLWRLGSFVLPEGSVMLVKGGAMLVFRHNAAPRSGLAGGSSNYRSGLLG